MNKRVAAAIAAYLEANDPDALAALLRGRQGLPREVRELLAQLISGELRRRPGRPREARVDVSALTDPYVIKRLAAAQNRGLTLTEAKRRVAEQLGTSVRDVERVMQRVRRRHSLPSRTRLYRQK